MDIQNLAKKILENPNITHSRLNPSKGSINKLREYLETVGYRLITTYRVTGKTPLPNSPFFRRKIGSLGVRLNKRSTIWKGIEDPQTRQYSIIKL